MLTQTPHTPARWRFAAIFMAVVLLIAISLMTTDAQDSAATVTTEQITLLYSGDTRTIEVTLPSEPSGAPLLLALHPTASSGVAMRHLTGLDRLASEHGYVVAYPNTLDRVWNEGRFEEQNPDGPDDVGFINALVKHLSGRYRIDRQQVYLTGTSTGGVMAVRLACTTPETFSGVALVASLPFTFHRDLCESQAAALPEGTRPAPFNLLIIAGTADPLFTQTPSELYNTIGLNQTTRLFGLLNDCDPTSLQFIEGRVAARWNVCRGDTVMAYQGVELMQTHWPRGDADPALNAFGIDAADLIADFFADPHTWDGADQPDFTGQSRSFVLYAPPSYDPAQPMPLVVVLHGRPGRGTDMAFITEMNRIAAQEGFLVVYPDGLNREWNYTRDIPFYGARPQDDVAFLSTLVATLGDDFNIDSTRIYATGFSNGGFMTQRLACEDPDGYAAFAVVGAGGFAGMDSVCPQAGLPVPIMFIHGTEDVSIPWEGQQSPVVVPGQGVRDIFVTFPVQRTLEVWTTRNGCDIDAVTQEVLPRSEGELTEIRYAVWNTCADGGAMEFYGILGGGHNWPGIDGVISPEIAGRVNMDMDASQVVWDFFTGFTR